MESLVVAARAISPTSGHLAGHELEKREGEPPVGTILTVREIDDLRPQPKQPATSAASELVRRLLGSTRSLADPPGNRKVSP
jgi:hypothetical protein